MGEERVGGGSVARRWSGGGETMLLILSVSCGGGGRESEGEVGGSGSSVDVTVLREASAFSTGKWDSVFGCSSRHHLPSTLHAPSRLLANDNSSGWRSQVSRVVTVRHLRAIARIRPPMPAIVDIRVHEYQNSFEGPILTALKTSVMPISN
jgi:hypothetical protein